MAISLIMITLRPSPLDNNNTNDVMGILSGDLQRNSPTINVEPLTESLLAIGCSDAIVVIVPAVRPPCHMSDFGGGRRGKDRRVRCVDGINDLHRRCGVPLGILLSEYRDKYFDQTDRVAGGQNGVTVPMLLGISGKYLCAQRCLL